MAQPGRAVVGTNYPISITAASGNYTVPQGQQDFTIQLRDTVTFSAIGGDCLVAFQGLPLGLMVSPGSPVTVQADLASGTAYWTPGPFLAGTLPYKIKVGSGVDKDEKRS